MKYFILVSIIAVVFAGCASKSKIETPATLDKESIRQSVKKVMPGIKNCYETFLATSKTTKRSGKIVMAWTVQESGETTDIGFKSDEFSNPKMQTCMTEALKKAKFPSSPQGLTAVIEAYPFFFHDHQVDTKPL